MRAKTKLAQTLGAGKWAITAECLPPRGADPSAVKKLAACFSAVLDAVVVADNHHDVRSSALACAALLAGEKLEPMLSMVTRDRNRVALESDVLGAAALGIRNFLCLTGTHQSLGTSPKAAGSYDLDATQLSLALSRMADDGFDFSGNKLDAAPDLFVAASAHPYLRPMELNLLGLRKKVAAGAQAIMTDAITELAGFEQWMEAVRSAGIDKKVAIIASVRPENVEIARKVRTVPGVRGIHLLSGGSEHLVAQVIKDASLA